MANVAEEVNMQIVEGDEMNGVIEENNNLDVMNHHQANDAMGGGGRRIRKKNLGEQELIARNQHVKMVNNLRITKKNIERKVLLSTYLKNKKRIERLTVSIQLNVDEAGNPETFKVRKWRREREASEHIVYAIAANNFPKKTPTHTYFGCDE